jgi:hypothetical protein
MSSTKINKDQRLKDITLLLPSVRVRRLVEVQGHCTGPPPTSNASFPLAQLCPGQCVLTLNFGLFEWPFSPLNIWLHGLYLYRPRIVEDESWLVNWFPYSQSRLYLTEVTFHRGRFGSGKLAYLAGAHLTSWHCLWLQDPVIRSSNTGLKNEAHTRTCGRCVQFNLILSLSMTPRLGVVHKVGMSA